MLFISLQKVYGVWQLDRTALYPDMPVQDGARRCAGGNLINNFIKDRENEKITT
jgi:hypothetical protein